MVTSTRNQSSAEQRQFPSAVPQSLGYDFALLGLSAHESRVEVIRRAAKQTAARIHDIATDPGEQDSMLTDLANSTYRLLDPRRRDKMLERVQLCVPSELDLDLQKGSRQSLLRQARPEIRELV